MTREAMAQVVDEATTDARDSAKEWRAEPRPSYQRKADAAERFADELTVAAAELRKVCATCQHFRAHRLYDGDPETNWGECAVVEPEIGHPAIVPFDGSGFCHRWQVEEGR